MEVQVNFSVSEDIARRAGLLNERYRTRDGRFILTDKDLQRVRLSADEIVNGLDAVRLTKTEAEALAAANGLSMGLGSSVASIGGQHEENTAQDGGEAVQEGEQEPAGDEPDGNTAEDAVQEPDGGEEAGNEENE
jgi:hypothetical protein